MVAEDRDHAARLLPRLIIFGTYSCVVLPLGKVGCTKLEEAGTRARPSSPSDTRVGEQMAGVAGLAELGELRR